MLLHVVTFCFAQLDCRSDLLAEYIFYVGSSVGSRIQYRCIMLHFWRKAGIKKNLGKPRFFKAFRGFLLARPAGFEPTTF